MFTLLLLILVVPEIGVLLWHVSLLLVVLLRPESCNVLLRGRVAGFLLLVDDIDHGPLLLVGLDPVVGEEGLVRIVDCHSGLILVGEQLPYVFWSSYSENLGEDEFVIGPNAVVGEGREVVLSLGALWFSNLDMNFLGFSPGLWARLARPSMMSLSSEQAVNSFLNSGRTLVHVL